MREKSKKTIKTRLLALLLVFCMTCQMVSYSPGNVVRAEGEDSGVSEALDDEGLSLPENITEPSLEDSAEESETVIPEEETPQPTDWTAQTDSLRLTLAGMSYQKGDEEPVDLNAEENKWDLSALNPEEAGRLTFKWQYAFAEGTALNSGDTFSLGMPKNAEGKAVVELKDTEAPVALTDEKDNELGSYEIEDNIVTVTLNETAAGSTEAVSGVLELSGVLNAEALKNGETTDAALAPQGEAGEQWQFTLPGKAAAEPVPEPAPTAEAEPEKENLVMNGLKALFGVRKAANETHSADVTNKTDDIQLEIGYVEYLSPDGVPTRCPITKTGNNATVDMSGITYEPGGRFRIELDFNLLKLENIQENDFFEFYIPKEFSFSGTLDQSIDLMDGSDKIAAYIVSKVDNNDAYAYLLKVTFAAIVDDPSVSGINGGVTFELGMNEDLGENASPHEIPLKIQGTSGPTTTIVTPGISHKIKGITKDALYDKEKGTITWSIGVGTDSSCAGSDIGGVKVTDTLPNELKDSIESVWVGPAGTGEKVDTEVFKQAGNAYTFPAAIGDKSYKAPQTLTIVTKVPDEVYNTLSTDKNKDASKTFENKAKMTSDSKFISFDGNTEASKAVTIKRPGVVKEGVQKSSDIIAWMITINDTGNDPRNNIYRAVVTDTMSEDLIFKNDSGVDMASTINVTNKDKNEKINFEEYTGAGVPNPDSSDKKNYYQYNADTKQLIFYFYKPETIGDAYTIEFDTKINTAGMDHMDYDQNTPNEKLRNKAELTCSWPHGPGPEPEIKYGLGPIDTDFKAAYVTKKVSADESTGIMTWTIDPGTRLETLGNYSGDQAVITDTIEDNQTYQAGTLKVSLNGTDIEKSKYEVSEPSEGHKELSVTITDAETLKQLNAIKLSYQTKAVPFYREPDSQDKIYHNRVVLKVTENGKTFTNDDEATAVFPNRFLNKSTKFVEENGELYMEYTITANENKMPLTSLTITDDFKELKTTIKNNNETTTPINLTGIDNIWTIESSKTSVSINGGSAETGDSITGASYSDNQFTYTPANPSGNSYTVKLYLKMTEDAKKKYLGQYDSAIFTQNTVTATGKSRGGDIDNYSVTSSGENEGKIENKLANKFSVENSDDMVLSWAIDINPHAAEMKTKSDQEMKIEDTIPAGLEFDLLSVKLYKVARSSKTEVTLNVDNITVTTDAEKKQTMTVRIPEDKTAYRLEYSTKIVGNVSGGNAQNNAVLSVGGEKISSSSDQNDIARTAWAKLERLTTYQFKKYDAQAGETLPLVGAKFGLYLDESCSSLVNYYESDEKGMVQFRGLENGKTYYYKEISAPNGYKSPEANVQGTKIVIDKEGGVITGQAVSNERIVHSSEVSFTKTFSGKESYITTATTDWMSTFKLWLYPISGNTSYKVPVELTGTDEEYQYSKAGKNATETEIKNKTDGSLKIKGLPWGSYALEEVKAADGYAVPEGDAALNKFSIAEDNGAVTYEKGDSTITNTETHISINKYLDNTTTRVEGARLSIHSGSVGGAVVKNPLTSQALEWTSDGSAWDIIGLPAGTYWLVEDSAPASNEQVGVAEPIQFELDVQGKIENHSDNTITMKDMTNTITVKKLDQFGIAVKGLKADTLQLKENNKDGTVVSAENPSGDTYVKVTLNNATGEYTFSGLHRDQVYYLEEPSVVSDNYLLARPITFKIDTYGKVLTDDTLNLNNEPDAPANLEGMNFTNTYDNNNTLTLRDERITGHATFTKWDNQSNGNPEIGDSELSGVSFDLYKVEASGDKKINEDSHFVSGEKESAGVVTTVGSTLINAETGEAIGHGLLPGTYYFKEVETHGDFVMPEGDAAKSSEFKVSEDNRYTWKSPSSGLGAKNVIKLEKDMYNTPLRTDIVLSKKDAGDNTTGVIGATYGLFSDEACTQIVKGGPNGTVERKVTTKGKNDNSDKWTDTNGNVYQHDITEDGQAYFCDVPRGQYWIKEISPAPGYTLDTNAKEVTVENTKQQTINCDVTNTQTEIKLKKVNSGNSILENSQFTIIPKENKTFADGTSGSKTLEAGTNAASLKGQLIAGDIYTISETILPAGYTKIDDVTIKVENNGNITVNGNRNDVTANNTNNTKLLTIKDTDTIFKFRKIDQFKGDVSGAELKLSGTFAKADSPISWNTSDANPKTIAGELIAGNQYTLSETTAPDGYQTAPEVTFTVSANGKSLTVNGPTDKRVFIDGVTLKLIDRKVMGHVQLTKTDSTNGDKLEGVTFELYKEGSPNDILIAELKTNVEGVVTTVGQDSINNSNTGKKLSNGLSKGKYYFKETSTLNNYVLNTKSVEFTVDNSNDYYNDQGDPVTAKLIQKTMTNTPFNAAIKLKKLDATSNTGIGDVAFILSKKEANGSYTPVAASELTGLKTTSNGELSFNVHEKGGYKLTETVPEGYTDSSEFEAAFELTDDCHDKTLEINSSTIGNATPFSMVKNFGEWNGNGILNTRKPASFTLEKIDSQNSSTKLSGAKFEVYTKTTEDFAGDNGKNLVLTAETGKTYDCSKKAPTETTGTVGQLALNNLPWGDYWIIETVPPAGYQLPANNTAKAFTVGAAALDVKWMSGEAITNAQNNLTLKKTDMEGNALSGAKLKIADSKGVSVADAALNAEASTWIITGALTADTEYFLYEENVPKGYETPALKNSDNDYLAKIVMGADGKISVIEDNTQNGLVKTGDDSTSLTIKNQSIEVTFNKTDMDGTALNGAEFEITGDFADGTDPVKITDSSAAAALSGKMVAGRQYTVTETTPPKGYKKAAPFTFTVNIDGTITLSDESASYVSVAQNDQTNTVTQITVKDDLVKTMIKKTDEDGKPIGGAEFTVTGKFKDAPDVETSQIVKPTADGAAEILNLIESSSKDNPDHIYTLKETRAADGYQRVTETAQFFICPEAKVHFVAGKDISGVTGIEVDEITMTFKDKPIELKLKKTDENSAPLAGVTFELAGKFADNPSESAQKTLVSDNNGGYTLDKTLIAGEEYTLKETKAPQQYQIYENEVKIKVTENGETIEIVGNHEGISIDNNVLTFQNKLKLGDIVFAKQAVNSSEDPSPTNLGGVTFGLYSDAECKSLIIKTAVSSDDGKVMFKDIPAGEYFIQETPQAGDVTQYYQANKTVYKADIDGSKKANTGEVYTIEPEIITNTAIRGSITLSKIDDTFKTAGADGSETDLALSGAQFAVCLKGTKTAVAGITEKSEIPGEYTLQPAGQIALGGGYTTEVQNSFGIPYLYDNKLLAGEYDIYETAAPGGYITPDNVMAELHIAEIATSINGEPTTQAVITNTIRRSTVSIEKQIETTADGSIDVKAVRAGAGYQFKLERAKEADGTAARFGYTATAVTGDNGKAVFDNVPVGQYQITEISVKNLTEPYVLPAAQTIIVHEDGSVDNGDKQNQFINALKRASITGVKTDTDTKQGIAYPVNGAVIGLFKDSQKVAQATTDEKGAYCFDNIPYGSYTLKEIAAPEGYVLNDTQTIDVKVSENDQEAQAGETITNTLLKGSLTLLKTNEDSSKNLPGAQFTLTGKNNYGDDIIPIVKTTGADGLAAFENLPLGSYILTETRQPSGYERLTQSFDVQVTADRNGNAAEVSMTQDKTALQPNREGQYAVTNSVSRITFTKEGHTGELCANGENADAILGARRPLKGAKFGLYTADHSLVKEAVSDEQGQVVFSDIASGTYLVKELEAPHCYQVDEAVYMAVVDENGMFGGLKAPDGQDIPGNKIVDDAVRSQIKVIKVDEQDPTKVLPGSTYGLFKKVAVEAPQSRSRFARFFRAATQYEDVLVATAVTDENGEILFEGLLTGVEYTVKELAAPAGSQVSEKPIIIQFTLEEGQTDPKIEKFEDGNGTAAMDKDGNITWYEPPIMVEVSKKDVNEKMLSGARLRITDENHQPVEGLEEWTSTDEAMLIKNQLHADKQYYLEEIEAPSGYTLAEPVPFKVTVKDVGPGENFADKLVMTDTLTSLFISKTTINGTDELPGAVLTVYEAAEDGSIVRDEAGNEVVARTITGESLSWTSGTEMKKIEGLKTGAYVLREITAPDGYEVAEEITFTLMPDGAVTVGGEACEGNIVRMQDKPAPETVTPGVPDKPQTSTPNNPEISGGADTGIAGLVNPATFWGVMALLSVTALLVCSVVVWRRKRW